MRAVGPRIDQRAGGPRGIVEQRLVPEACGVMRVERQLRGGERREAVIIVERVKQTQMQDRFETLAAQIVTRFVGAGLPESGGRLLVSRPTRRKTFSRDQISVFGLYHLAIHVNDENIVRPEHFVEKPRDDFQQIRAFFIVPFYNKPAPRIESIC